jgi:hypothetical protein
MAKHAMMSKPLQGMDQDDQVVRQGPGENDEDGAKILTDPNAEVDGRTIIQWSEQWQKALDNTPAGDVNGFNDPDGTVAGALNDLHSKMYFITSDPRHVSTRTFNVSHDQDVFLPIVGRTDGEGPGIEETLPGFVPTHGSFADEVKTVLANTTFSDVTLKVDGKLVTHLHETSTGIFSAGVAEAGTAAVDFFCAEPGASLSTVGEAGYFAVLKDLSDGMHTITTTSVTTFFGHVGTEFQHTDNIIVHG